MGQRLLDVPAVDVAEGPLSHYRPKYADRAAKVGARYLPGSGQDRCLALFIGEKTTLDGIESEADVRPVAGGAAVATALDRVPDVAGWTGPPLNSRADLVTFLRP